MRHRSRPKTLALEAETFGENTQAACGFAFDVRERTVERIEHERRDLVFNERQDKPAACSTRE